MKSVTWTGARWSQHDDDTFIKYLVKGYFWAKDIELFQSSYTYFEKRRTLTEDPNLHERMTIAERRFGECYRLLEAIPPAERNAKCSSCLGRFRKFFFDKVF